MVRQLSCPHVINFASWETSTHTCSQSLSIRFHTHTELDHRKQTCMTANAVLFTQARLSIQVKLFPRPAQIPCPAQTGKKEISSAHIFSLWKGSGRRPARSCTSVLGYAVSMCETHPIVSLLRSLLPTTSLPNPRLHSTHSRLPTGPISAAYLVLSRLPNWSYLGCRAENRCSCSALPFAQSASWTRSAKSSSAAWGASTRQRWLRWHAPIQSSPCPSPDPPTALCQSLARSGRNRSSAMRTVVCAIVYLGTWTGKGPVSARPCTACSLSSPACDPGHTGLLPGARGIEW